MPPLVPTPRSFRHRRGQFRIRVDIPIILAGGADDSDFRAASALRSRIAERTGDYLPIETHARTDDLEPRIELRRNGGNGQGYRLLVEPRTILVSSEGASGLRYGVETLGQLVAAGGRSIAACEIEDAPRLERRGLLIDISRGKVPTVATLAALVDDMVHLKLNLLMLYTEHVFRFRRHPQIGKGAWPMEAAELRELDAYAAERHVELVPTLQSLGHMRHILELRRYRHLAESERGWSLSPSIEESYHFLEELYSEYLPNFRSRWFNANCDEPVDLGKGRSRDWAAKEGPGAVYRAHLDRVRALAEKLGKRTMVWGDFVQDHPEEIPRLDRRLVLLDWWYEAEHDYERVRRFRDKGIAFMVCPGTSSWNALYPRVDNALENIRRYAEAGIRHGAAGLVTTDWGDGGHYNLLGNSLFCFAWGAELAWKGADVDARGFDRGFSLHLFGDPTRSAARLYRRLGGLHRTGFEHFNHSPLKSVYFDDLSDPKYIRKIEPRVLRRTLKEIEKVEALFESSQSRLARRPAERDELQFAIASSLLAARKGVAGREFLGWRARPSEWSAREKRRLASELERLAKEQAKLRRWLRKLWLARNRPSNFEITSRYYDVSIRGLRRARRELERS